MLILFHRHWRFWLVVWFYLLLALVVLIYWPGLSGPLLLDDAENLLILSDYHRGATTWQQVVFENVSSRIGRPLSMLSFLFDVVTRGTLYFNFKYHNLMLHLFAGSLLFWLVGRLSSIHWPPPRAWTMALMATSLWLLSPLQLSAVLYVVQRMTLLSSLLMLIGLLCYTIGRQGIVTRPRLGWTLILSSYFVWTPLAILAKETGALLPLLCLVLELFVFRISGSTEMRRQLFRLHFLLGLLPLLVGMGVLFWPKLGLLNYQGRDFSMMERLLTEPRVLWDYAGRFFLPLSRGLGVFHDDYEISTHLLSPVTTLPALLGLALVFSLAWKLRSGPWFAIGFGIAFFLAGHAMESSFLSLELYFEHRNYLPSLGLSFGAAFILVEGWCRSNHRILVTALLILYLGGMAIATNNMASIWSDMGSLLRTSEIHHPRSPRVMGGLAQYQAVQGNIESALHYLQQTLELDNRLTTMAALQAITLYCLADSSIPDSAYERIAQVMDNRRENATIAAIKRIALLMDIGRCPQLNLAVYAKALERGAERLPPRQASNLRWFALTYAGDAYISAGQSEPGLQVLSRAEVIFPDRLDPGLIRLRWMISECNLDAARSLLMQLRVREPKWRKDYGIALDIFDKDMKSASQTRCLGSGSPSE